MYVITTKKKTVLFKTRCVDYLLKTILITLRLLVNDSRNILFPNLRIDDNKDHNA